MKLREKLYDLKNQRKTAIDEAEALVLAGKLDSDEYTEKTEQIKALGGQIDQVEALLAEVEKTGGEDDALKKGVKGAAAAAAGGDGDEDEDTDAVKAFADAARAHFAVSKADTLAGTLHAGADTEGGYTVPEDIVTRVETYRGAKSSLRDLVTVESVTAPSGRRTFKKRSQQTGFVKVGEGGKIPKGTTPQFEVKNYEVSKYAGFFAVTNELLEDSDENITNCLVAWIGDEARVTDNKLILAAIQKKAAVDFKDLDGLKKALYVTLDAAFRATSSIVTNADGVYFLSMLKDANGRDLLQPVPSDPGKMQLAVGATVFPVREYPNADLPSNGTKVPFILGDLKEGIRLFDRKVLTLTASNVATAGTFNAYEQDMILTKAVERLDVQQWDAEAYLNGYIDTAAVAADAGGGEGNA